MKLMKQHLAELAASFLSRLNSVADCSPYFFLLMWILIGPFEHGWVKTKTDQTATSSMWMCSNSGRGSHQASSP